MKCLWLGMMTEQEPVRVSEQYFFWTGQGSVNAVARNWRRSLRKLFRLAGIRHGHPQ